MQPPRYRTLSVSAEEGVILAALARPASRNAVDGQMRADLTHLFTHAAEYGRAVLLTGQGDVFCAGQDLGEGASLRDLDLGRTMREEYAPLLAAIHACPAPTLAAVNGDAAGAGLHLALACDVVIAAESARLSEIAGQIGLIPDAGGTWRLPRLIGPARAMGMALFGEQVSAETAEIWGLIWRAFPDRDLMTIARRMAARMAEGPVRGHLAARQAMHAAMENGFEAQIELEAQLQAELGRSRDFAEAMAAMREGRSPRFEGR